MSDISLSHPQCGGSNKSFKFGWSPGEVPWNEGDLVDDSFPLFFLSLSGFEYGEHFSLVHGFDFLYWCLPSSCFFFSFLFDHVREDFVSLVITFVFVVVRADLVC